MIIIIIKIVIIIIIIIKKTNILQGGLQSPSGGFQEGPLENKKSKNIHKKSKIQKSVIKLKNVKQKVRFKTRMMLKVYCKLRLKIIK